MISRFLSLGAVPELRLEARSSDEERRAPEIELALDIEDYWELTELMQRLRYAMEVGQAAKPIWKRIRKIVQASIVAERDRTWFQKQGS